MGYQEWPKGRTLEQYIKDNQKEELYGTRYVFWDDQKGITASLMMLTLRPSLFGIGSVVVLPACRGRGVGSKLLKDCMALVEEQHPHAAFMLYSEIGTGYYQRLGFQPLPDFCQRFPQGICMVRASPNAYSQIAASPVPDYF